MEYVNHTFSGGHVLLDGNTFERCIFANCTLVHEGGPFSIKNGMRVEGRVDFDLQGGEATLGILDLLGRNLGYVSILGRTYRLVDDEVADQVAPTGDNQAG